MLYHILGDCVFVLGVEFGITERCIRLSKVDGIMKLKNQIFQVFFGLDRVEIDFIQKLHGVVGTHGTGQIRADSNEKIVQLLTNQGIGIVLDLLCQGVQEQPRRWTPCHG